MPSCELKIEKNIACFCYRLCEEKYALIMCQSAEFNVAVNIENKANKTNTWFMVGYRLHKCESCNVLAMLLFYCYKQ